MSFQLLHKGGVELIYFNDIYGPDLLARDGAEEVWNEIRDAIPGVEKDFEGVNLDGMIEMLIRDGVVESDK